MKPVWSRLISTPENRPRSYDEEQEAEQGVYLVLAVFLLFGLFVALFIMVSFGLVVANRIKLQNVANLASLATIESWSSETLKTLPERKTAAVEAANRIVAVPGVKLFSMSSETLTVAQDTGPNRLEFVYYANSNHSALPAAIRAACGTGSDDYPCLARNSQGFSNATLLTLKSQLGFSLPFPWLPIGGITTSERQGLSTTAQRCIMAAVDASTSITAENFSDVPVYTETTETCRNQTACKTGSVSSRLTCLETCARRYAAPAALFVYRASQIEKAADTPYEPSDCNSFTLADLVPRELDIWCAMINWGDHPKDEPNPTPRWTRPNGVFTEGVYYRSDYERRQVGDDFYWVNTIVSPPEFMGPKPWEPVMSALNSVVQLLRLQATSVDRIGMFVFDTAVRGKMPLSPDLDPLLQRTNPANRGLKDLEGTPVAPELHPSFLDNGWFPVIDANSDIRLALETLYTDLTNTAICPEDSQRVAILVTDGLMNVFTDPLSGHRVGANNYSGFVKARRELVLSNMLQTYTQARINLITIVFGAGGPSIRNISDGEGGFLFPEDLIRQGRRHYNWGTTNSNPANDPPVFIFDTPGGVTPDLSADLIPAERDAWNAMQKDPTNSAFHGALGVLFDLSKVFCPLVPGASPRTTNGAGEIVCAADYELDSDNRCRLKDSARTENARETRPLFQETFQEQAANCLTSFLRNIPYQLTEIPQHQVECTSCSG